MKLSKANIIKLTESLDKNFFKIINLNIFGNEIIFDISTSNPTLQYKKSIEGSIKNLLNENIQSDFELKINFKIEINLL